MVCAQTAGIYQSHEYAKLPLRIVELDLPDLQELGYLGAKSMLTDEPSTTAIFAAADLAAEGVCRALRDRSLRVGDDISVAGFNDIEARVMHPPLSSVRQFPELVGKRLAQMILERVTDGSISASGGNSNPTGQAGIDTVNAGSGAIQT